MKHKLMAVLAVAGILVFAAGMAGNPEPEAYPTHPPLACDDAAVCAEVLMECWELVPAPGGCPYPSVCNSVQRAAQVDCFQDYANCFGAP